MASAMRETMWAQPGELRRLLTDDAAIPRLAERLRGRRVLLIGTGTSWHAAGHGSFFLRRAGLEAWPVQASDAALYGLEPTPNDALILLSHRGTKTFTSQVLERARERGVPTIVISRLGSPANADLETVENERSSAFTGSHLAALLRLAQLAAALGADLGDLASVPAAVETELAGPGPGVVPPERLLEFTGAGTNQWTAAEGALKVRETAYIPSEGLSVEQFLHGPSVALGARDTLVCLDGGGPMAERLGQIADAARATGITVHHIVRRDLGEPLSIFPLTANVQRIALECAEALGTNPDSFGYDIPGRRETWGAIPL
ncbi:MAG TPA: SIS domain-containing protein [Chloroflexota bacterium]|nr:SIS domain-containing protein [Chloroflexota bacterium]